LPVADAPPVSRLERRLQPLQRLPRALRLPVAGWIVGRAIPFVGTGGVRVHALSREGVELSLLLRRRVRNHLGSTHAAATALLVETAGGLAMAMHLPDQRTLVVKSMRIDYRRVSRGMQRATARVPAEALAALQHEPAGQVVVPVQVEDDDGDGVVDCHMVYAWFTRDSTAGR